MEDEKPKRAGGRPPKFTGEVGRISHSLRIQPSVDTRVRAAAAANCRSIAEELEARVKSTVDGIVLFPETPDLRKALQISAEENGRPVTTEAEARLVESFEQDRVFGRPETYALLVMLARDIERIERDLGMSWLDGGEIPDNTVAEDLIDAFSQRVIWELARGDRRKARGIDRRKPDAADRQSRMQSERGKPISDGVRWATPDEIDGMVEAPGQLPPSIGDQAIFDEITGELPLVKAERAEAARGRAKAPLDVGAGSPDAVAPPATPKRRGRAKAPAEE